MHILILQLYTIHISVSWWPPTMSPKPMTVLRVKVKPKMKLLEAEMKAEANTTWKGEEEKTTPYSG